MKILHVATEAFPYVKIGGLSDVMGSLPPALRGLGVDARLLVPGLAGVLEGAAPLTEVRVFDALPGATTARLLSGTTDRGVPLYVLDAPTLFARSRDPYADFGDSHLPAAALARAAAEIARTGDGAGWKPGALHCHDWQTGLGPAYLRFSGTTMPSVITLHNIAYQGLFEPDVLPALGLPGGAYSPDGLEFWGKINFLKAAVVYATRITTVSPRYAREIQTPEGGHGLDGVIRARAAEVRGILNGIDETVWDPSRSPHLAVPFDARRLDLRSGNKAAVQAEVGLAPEPRALLFGIVSRLNVMKGHDLVVDNVDHLVGLGAQLVVVGKGDPEIESAFASAAARHPGRISFRGAQNEPLAHRVFAGADAMLVPSRTEPCGLVQLYAMRYGALPVVRYTGGLADTVRDETTGSGATGFTFDAPTGFALGATIARAVSLYRTAPARWKALQGAGMARDFSWNFSARVYVEMYRELLGR